MVFNEVYRNYMMISWNPPLDDGGCAVSNYIIEKRDTNRDLWMPVTSSCTRTSCRVGEAVLKCLEGKCNVQDPLFCTKDPEGKHFKDSAKEMPLDSNSLVLTNNSCCPFLQVPKLIEGREYIIRIMAQNIYGISDPLLSAETKARDVYSKCKHTDRKHS